MSPNGYDVSAGGTQPFFRQGQILSLLPSLPPSGPSPFPPSNFRPGPGPSLPSLHPSVHHSSPTTFFPRSPWVLTHRTRDSGYRVTYCGLGWGTVLGIVGLVGPIFKPKCGSKSKIPGRILNSCRCFCLIKVRARGDPSPKTFAPGPEA